MNLKPTAARQLSEEGIIVFWQDGAHPGSRQGLACILSCTDTLRIQILVSALVTFAA